MNTDEAFASHVDRLSHRLDLPRHAIYRATGIEDTRAPTGLPGYGAFLSAERLHAYAYATNLEPESVRSSLLLRFEGIIPEIDRWSRTGTLALKASYAQTWLYVWGSNLCPRCLNDSGGAWKITWKLPWVFACLEHKLLLFGTCPGCRQRLGRPSSSGHPRVPLRQVVAQPGTCTNIVLQGNRVHECGHQLTSAAAADLEGDATILGTQRLVFAALNGHSLELAGRAVTSRTFFSELRVLTQLLLTHSTTSGHIRGVGAHPRAPAAPGSPRVPTDPFVVASLTTDALNILLAPTIAEANERAATLLDWIETAWSRGLRVNRLNKTLVGAILRYERRRPPPGSAAKPQQDTQATG